jgi:hypothetical protein
VGVEIVESDESDERDELSSCSTNKDSEFDGEAGRGQDALSFSSSSNNESKLDTETSRSAESRASSVSSASSLVEAAASVHLGQYHAISLISYISEGYEKKMVDLRFAGGTARSPRQLRWNHIQGQEALSQPIMIRRPSSMPLQ